MAITRTLPEKDSAEGYETQFNRNSDAADMRGAYLQNDTSNDANVLVSRDASDNMTFVDPNAGTKTLTQLSPPFKDHLASANTTIPAATSTVVARYIEIAAGITVEIGAGGDLEIT